MKRTLLLVLTTTIVAVLLFGCSGDEQTADTPDEEALAASVEDWSITKTFLVEYIAQLPESQRRKFETHQGRAEAAERTWRFCQHVLTLASFKLQRGVCTGQGSKGLAEGIGRRKLFGHFAVGAVSLGSAAVYDEPGLTR